MALEGVAGEQDHFPVAPGGEDSIETGSRSPSLPKGSILQANHSIPLGPMSALDQFPAPKSGKEIILYKLKKRLKNNRIMTLTEDQLLLRTPMSSHDKIWTSNLR